MNISSIEQGLAPGDLLFQLSIGGEREWLISRLFEGIGGQGLNHVALYIGSGLVIEAVSPDIRKTSIDAFFERSVKGLNSNPCVTILRLSSFYRSMIPSAIKFAENCLAQPYNNSYGSQSGWYCSQLILEAFRHANKGCYLFEKTPMSFQDPDTGELFSYWVEYYKSLDLEVPQGEMGSHPALLSLSDKLEIVEIVGQIPFKSTNTIFNYFYTDMA